MYKRNKSTKNCIDSKSQEAIQHFFYINPESLFMTPEEFNKIKEISGDEENALLQISIALADKNNYVPISNYKVGACVLGISGKVYFGKNFEFKTPMLVQTLHAEQTAIHNAAYHNERVILKLAVNAAPCGSCRQYLIELGHPKDLTVIFCSGDVTDSKSKIISNTLQQLLPDNFGPLNLNEPPVPFALTHKKWIIEEKPNDNLNSKAKQMLEQSYAPYTKLPSGISATLNNDKEYGGQTIENAAYNPTVSSLRGLLSLLNVINIDLNEIKHIILYQGFTDVPSAAIAGRMQRFDFIPLLKSILPNTTYDYMGIKISQELDNT